MWTVLAKKSVVKSLASLPKKVQYLFADLNSDLQNNGPIQRGWNNFSALENNQFHCHLKYHYVACWTVVNSNTCIIEVYYVGTREGAPY